MALDVTLEDLYRVGYEHFVAFAPGNAWLSPITGTLPALTGVLKLGGLINTTSFERNEDVEEIYGAASYRAADIVQGPVDFSLNTSMVMAAYSPGVNGGPTNSLIEYALRNTSLGTPTGSAANHYHCGLPILDMAVGNVNMTYGSRLETARAFTQLARYSLISKLDIVYQEGNVLRANIDVMPLTVQASGTTYSDVQLFSTDGTGGTGTNIFGDPMIWANAVISFAGHSQNHAIASANISIDNSLRRVGRRLNYDGSGGTSVELSRCPRDIQAGREKVTLNFTLHSPIPAALQGVDWGTITMTATGKYGVTDHTYTVTIADARIRATRENASIDDAVNFSASLAARNISIAYA